MSKSRQRAGLERGRLRAALAIALLGAAVAQAHPQTTAPPRQVRVPAAMGEGSLAERRRAQIEATAGLEVPHDFGFHDALEESGIRFRHAIVDDAGRRYKAVHYDHGNGVAVADVDGDGRLDLYFPTQMGSNQLWRNAGGGRFEDLTAVAGVAMAGRVSVAGSFADYDSDGDPDLFVTTVRTGNALFENDGAGRFREVTQSAGVAYSGHSSVGVFFDYDNDGWLDLLLVNVGTYTSDERGRGGYFVGLADAFKGHIMPWREERSVLYRNLGGGSFADVSEEALLLDRSWSGDATPVDFNGDGWRDLYVLDMQGPDHYYENVRGRFFVDRTAAWFPRTPAGSMGVKSFDWNNDGRFDLLLTDMHSDMSEEIGPEREKLKARPPAGAVGLECCILGNALFERAGDGFREVSDEVGAENYWPWGVSVDDLNADGWDDVFITASMNFPFRYGVNSVLLNDRGLRFVDAEFVLGVEPRRGPLVIPWFELDCDAEEPDLSMAGWEIFGRPGIAERSGEGSGHPLCGDGGGRVTVLAARGSRSSVIFDLDGDGDLDVVTSEFNDRPQVLVSDLAERREVRYLAVGLRGRASNRDALGAVVRVTAGGLTRLKAHDGQTGYLSHGLQPLYFGLGESSGADAVEVLWPAGARQRFEDLPANRSVLLVEPAAAAPPV